MHRLAPLSLIVSLSASGCSAQATGDAQGESETTEGGDVPDLPDEGDPSPLGSTLPAFAPSCTFVDDVVPFAAVPLEFASNAVLRLGPCGHASDSFDHLIYPDTEVAALPLGSIRFALTGELAWVDSGSTITLFDLEARSSRVITADDAHAVPSFVDGVAGSRLLTCVDDRIEVHDGDTSWQLDDGVVGCVRALARAAPVVVYRRGAEFRLANTDTGFVTRLPYAEVSEDPNCARVFDLGFDGDLVYAAWFCADDYLGPDNQPVFVEEIVEFSLYSRATGTELLFSSADLEGLQLPLRGGAWWLIDETFDAVSVFVDGELVPLFARLVGWTVVGDLVFAIDRDPQTNSETLWRSSDGGYSFEALGTRPTIGELVPNREATAVGTRAWLDGETRVELWLAGTWPLDPPIIRPGNVDLSALFADGSMVLHDTGAPLLTTLLGPDGVPVQEWPEYRHARRFDDRMVTWWGEPEPVLIPGGLALLDADGTSTDLVVEPGVAAKTVTTAPVVGAVAAVMVDASGATLYYGRPPD